VKSFNIQQNHLVYMDTFYCCGYCSKSPLPTKWSINNKVVILDLNAKFEWTTTSMSPPRHCLLWRCRTLATKIFIFWPCSPKLMLFCAFSLVLFWDWKVPSKKNRVEVLHLHHVTISISIILLWNTIIFEFVPTYGEKWIEKCRCQVLDRGWILGIY
jgi:hypothetical protein